MNFSAFSQFMHGKFFFVMDFYEFNMLMKAISYSSE